MMTAIYFNDYFSERRTEIHNVIPNCMLPSKTDAAQAV
jgi:hypothetical protein